MTNEEVLYYIGLVLVIMYIIIGLDDFIWDIVTVIKRLKHEDKHFELKDLDSKPPKLISLIVAAWHEDNVLQDVIENIISSQQYPRSMYHIFVGVYPNDSATMKAVKALEKQYHNVHCIVNYKVGPTSKAQNINHVISCIKKFEKSKNLRFSAITIHDSEDVVHPYEFKVTNYLLDKYHALQFPVFPLIRKPTLWNFFKNITSNTYADEFAENHYITMVSRHKMGAFVPSAGTGFSLSRDIIDELGEFVLPESSVTEDYRLALTLYEKGLQMHYVLERIKRVNSEGKLRWDYIATRSMFPNTFKTAVKQKTRWTLGITMQSYSFREVFNNNMNFTGSYSLYKDQKAKIGNLLSVIGYPVLIYFIISLFMPLTPIYPFYSISWYLSLIVTVMMIERQFFRAVSLYNVYGLRSAFFGCFFPPLLPIRIVWGNIINFVSTVKAYIQLLGTNQKETKKTQQLQTEEYNAKRDVYKENQSLLEEEKEKAQAEMKFQENNNASNTKIQNLHDKKFVWAKTDHSFLDKEVLNRFHRKFGDVLVEKGYLTAVQLKLILNSKNTDQHLGTYLLDSNYITEKQLIEVLSSVKHVQYLHKESLKYYNLQQFTEEFDKEILQSCSALPLLKTSEGYVFAYSEYSPINAQSILRKKLNKNLTTVLTEKSTIEKGLNCIFGKAEDSSYYSPIYSLYLQNLIEPEQMVIIRNYASVLNVNENEILNIIGLSQTA